MRQGEKSVINAQKTLMALSILFLLLLTGCGVASNPASGGGGNGGGGGSNEGGGSNGGGVISSSWPEDNESVQGVVMRTQQLSPYQCLINPNGGFTISQTTTFWAFSWARYGTDSWVLDQNDAQLCQAGQAFQGYPLTPQGKVGVNSITLPAGTYFLALQDLGNSSNAAGAELDLQGGPPNMSYVGLPFTTVTQSYNPGGWVAIPLIIQPNTRVWVDGGNSGGQVYMMTSSQAQTFESQYASGYFGGVIGFVDNANSNPSYCGFNGSSDADAPEQCDLTSDLPPGQYVMVYINTTSSSQWLTAWGLVYQ